MKRRLSLAEKIGLASFVLAAALAAVHPGLTVMLLALFLGFSGSAPFFPAAGFFLPVIPRAAWFGSGVALTFDDGPDPTATPDLLRLLKARHVQAAFFVVGEKAARHPELIHAMIADGHAVGNHSLRHDPVLMLRRPAAIFQDIVQTQALLAHIGAGGVSCVDAMRRGADFRPLMFRPVAGITNPELGAILERLGLMAVTYSLRARDGGRRRFVPFAERLARTARSGDILALHDAAPRDPRSASRWLREVDRLITGLRRKGLEPVGLEQLLARPVMEFSPDRRAGAGDRDPENGSWSANGPDAPGTGRPCPLSASGGRKNTSARA